MYSSKNILVRSVSFRRFMTKMGRAYYSVLPSVEKKTQSPSLKLKSKKDPFMKNVFVGEFDQDFLVYPEILNEEETKDIEERVARFKEILKSPDKPIEKTENVEKKSEFELMVQSGLLKVNVPSEFGGMELKSTHVMKMCEALDVKPSEALLLDLHKSLIIETLLKFGSTSQKEKYIRKLINGEIQAAYAMAEKSSGSDPTAIKTTAKFVKDHYEISGEKSWVTNSSNADIFIIFAKVKSALSGKDQTLNDLSAFIIDRESLGVSISETEPTGLENCGISTLKMENVIVPVENMIGLQESGYDIAAYGLKSHKYFTSSCILNTLKSMLSDATSYIKRRKQHFKDLKDSEHVIAKLAKATMNVYAMESMLYFVTGAMDQYEIDTSLEVALIQIFAFERCLDSMKSSLELLGALGFDRTNHYWKRLNDIYGLTLSNKTVDVLKLYVSLLGVQHAGMKIANKIKKVRNPLDFPGFVFKKIINDSRQIKDNPKLNKNFYLNLHPSLKDAGEQLEYCVTRFEFAVEKLLAQHGSAIIERQLDLIRLSDIALDIFSMTSVLGRASRSYCTGIRHCDHEITLAQAYCQFCAINVKQEAMNVIEGAVYSNDHSCLILGKEVIEKGQYFVEHPTLKNIK